MAETKIEDLVSNLMLFVTLETGKLPRPKRLAVERYMRTFVKSLTRHELELYIGFYATNRSLDPDLTFKINQASEGYNRYMSMRSRRQYYNHR